jgi:uncharacterized protein YPO0396
MTATHDRDTLDIGSLPLPASAPTGVDVPLFYAEGATEGTTQWKAGTFQLVNWGGFEGRVRFDFNPGATLISGASGTGKSTLLDAYIALMMPSDTSFNGASNDAVGGRARSAEQRHLLSYLRGQVDTTADDVGRSRPKVLRGDGRATWGAVGMTFIDDRGRRFTALRVYFVPKHATRPGEITMRMATFEGFLDLAEIEPAATQQFAPKLLKTMFPGLLTHDTYAAFAARLHTKLGIGANGDGSKALRLLVRIQSGHRIRTVDELYKEMVLERPPTYDAADRALAHFDDLEAAYHAMHVEQQKAELLMPVQERYAELVAARELIARIDTYGLTREGDTPIGLWALRTEAFLLEHAVDVNAEDRRENRELFQRAKTDEEDLTRQLEAARIEHHDAGGAQLDSLAAEVETEKARRAERLERRDALAGKTMALASPLATRSDFDALVAAADEFLGTYDETDAQLLARRDQLNREQFPLLQRRTDLRDERESFAGRSGRVPKYLDDLRRQVCAAVGMTAEELPFLAELIDVKTEHARWRTAVEVVLATSARLLLVPDDNLREFSTAIDPLQLRGRITFEGVPLYVPVDSPEADSARIAGKIEYRESPFTGWVRRRVSGPAHNALCAEDAADLDGPGLRVTLAGQTRRGMRGSHGRTETANIIGFSNVDAIAEIDAELEQLEPQLAQLDRRRQGVDDERANRDRRRRAYEAVLGTRWDDIDVGGCEARIRELEDTRTRILTADDRLRALAAHFESLAERLEGAQEKRFALQRRTSDLNKEHGRLAERQDVVAKDMYRTHHEQRVQLTDEQAATVDEEFAAAVIPADPDSLGDFSANLVRLRQRLLGKVDIARSDAAKAEQALESIFGAYLLKWPDPNLGRTAESYPDYAAILERILTTGLHERRAEWRARLVAWSGEDLVPLAGALQDAVDDIENRLAPINDILALLPFGATQDRLRIRMRRLAPANVAQFRTDLRLLSSTATKQLTDDQLEARFHALQQFMGQIRRRDDPRASPEVVDRDSLLDVRRHVEITAERYRSPGELLSTHSSLGDKSGGESQELIAFIVGAALRFRLGDELRARPRFAPVFLDEGFVKSDAEFTGRAVQAWKGLGFQLIVGAPLDKVAALEPHMDEMLAITKNTTTSYSFVSRIADASQP